MGMSDLPLSASGCENVGGECGVPRVYWGQSFLVKLLEAARTLNGLGGGGQYEPLCLHTLEEGQKTRCTRPRRPYCTLIGTSA